MKKIALVMTFDSNYLPKMLVAYRSLTKYFQNFDLYAYCFDSLSFDILSDYKYKNVIPVSYKMYENQKLLEIKEQKGRLYEYYWTCIPYLTQKTLNTNKYEFVFYADADLMFYSNPVNIIDVEKNTSILMQPNNFSSEESWQFVPVGYYCGGWTGFRNNKEGKKALNYWTRKCIEWCNCRFEDNKFGGQKYLDDWKIKFKNVEEVTDIGACVAPWNVNKYSVSKYNTQVLINNRWPLIYYHFHSFKMNLSDYKYIITGDRNNNYKIPPKVKRFIYAPYIKEMRLVIKELKKNGKYRSYIKTNPFSNYKLKEEKNVN